MMILLRALQDSLTKEEHQMLEETRWTSLLDEHIGQRESSNRLEVLDYHPS